MLAGGTIQTGLPFLKKSNGKSAEMPTEVIYS
jgi:hypothetical protein